MAKKPTGRPSIFSPKDGGQRYEILALTKRGQQLFEQARAKLQKLTGWTGKVSNADTLEMVVRGEEEGMRYLRHRSK